MNSTSADFQNLYQATNHSAARSPDALALAFEEIGAICTAIFVCGYSGRWRSLIAAGRCAKATVFCWRGNHPAFCEVLFCRAEFGREVVPFNTKLKQASEALVGHITPPGCPVRCDRTGLAEKTPLTRVRFHSANGEALYLPEPR
ncbi:hypothetical protein MJ575_14840 [Klebsiella pneumoniae]|nr:hypothetical protein MJ575_14840 [Klebsiella pneumoniae]